MTQHKKKVYTNIQENFKITPRLKVTLQKASDKKGVSKSLIIRTALEQWLDRNMPGWRVVEK